VRTSSGEIGSVLASLWSVVMPSSAVLCCLRSRGGRTGAVAFDKPCRTERFLSKPSLSACIDKSLVGGPQAHDNVHLPTTGRAEGDERFRGLATRCFTTEGAHLRDHAAEGVGRDGAASMEKAEVSDFHETVRENVLEEPAEKLHGVEGSGAWA
jgi:hypothetical protein